jgi:hypothetical protein
MRIALPGADTCPMHASDDATVRRAQGEAALQEWLARSLEGRAAAARRIGAIADAERAEGDAARARERARRAIEGIALDEPS